MRLVYRYGFPAIFLHNIEIVSGVQGKYGVVSSETLKKDLETWELMSFAGRLHKPVRFLKEAPADIKDGLGLNLKQAVTVSQMFLKESDQNEKVKWDDNDVDEILRGIVGLSYLGDIRMKVGAEATDKLDKILNGNRKRLEELYFPLIEKPKDVKKRLPQSLVGLDRVEVRKRIERVNGRSSRRLILNQILTDSISSNVRYLISKLRKGIMKR